MPGCPQGEGHLDTYWDSHLTSHVPSLQVFRIVQAKRLSFS